MTVSLYVEHDLSHDPLGTCVETCETWLTVPDDPEWLALRLPRHRTCSEDATGHEGCVWEAKRLLRNIREEKA